MPKRILVLGGTGMLGKPVVRRLTDDGFAVRVLARNVEKAKASCDGSVEIVQGDVAERDLLQAALADCHGVHISVGGDVDQISAENVAAVAPGMGVQQITYISGATVAEKNRWFPMVAQKLNAEKAIRDCGVAHTILCPTWAMEQLPRFARNGKPSLLGSQPLPVHFLAADDLACMVSKAYQLEEAKNKRLYAFGPEAMTMKIALERYCAVFHPDVKRIPVMPLWLARLLGVLTGNRMLKFAAGLMAYFDKTAEVGDTSEADAILGPPGITLDAWLEARKSAGD